LWWIHAENSPGLYHGLGFGRFYQKHPKEWRVRGEYPKRIICKAKTSNTWEFVFMPAAMIFDQSLVVIVSDRDSLFAQLQSSLHREWAVRHGSSLKTDMSYTASTVLETFPFAPESPTVDVLAREYLAVRQEYLQSFSVGLTGFHNALHDESRQDPLITMARGRYASLDNGVLESYGWGGLSLDHDFRPVPYLPEDDCVRFTISEAARVEVLRRLAELNRQRYEEEQVSAPAARLRAKGGATVTPDGQGALALPDVPESGRTTPRTKVVALANKVSTRSSN
jgi:hypothetical protein